MTYDNFVVEYSYWKRIGELLNEYKWLDSLQSHYEYKTVQMHYFIFCSFMLFIVDKKLQIWNLKGKTQSDIADSYEKLANPSQLKTDKCLTGQETYLTVSFLFISVTWLAKVTIGKFLPCRKCEKKNSLRKKKAKKIYLRETNT